MNTKQIVDYLSGEISSQFSGKVDYEYWVSVYRFWESERKEFFPDIIKNLIPLREPVIKLIYKNIYNETPFDREYILSKYERKHLDTEYLVYPCNKPEKMIVLFSGFSNRKTYNRYSWFWDVHEKWSGNTVYLFLNDVDNSWYSGFVESKTNVYKEIIKKIISEYKVDAYNTFLVGGSMGGYAALRFGIEMECGGIIAIHPQIAREATKLHSDPSWYNNIEKAGLNFIDIEDIVVSKQGALPPIYIEYGSYPADSHGMSALIEGVLSKRCLLIANKHSSTIHTTRSPSIDKITSLISLFELESLSPITAEMEVISS